MAAGGYATGSILNVRPRIHVDFRSVQNHHPLLTDADINHQIMTYIDYLHDHDLDLYNGYYDCLEGIKTDVTYELRIESTVTFTPPKSTGIMKYTVAACRNYYQNRKVHDTGEP